MWRKPRAQSGALLREYGTACAAKAACTAQHALLAGPASGEGCTSRLPFPPITQLSTSPAIQTMQHEPPPHSHLVNDVDDGLARLDVGLDHVGAGGAGQGRHKRHSGAALGHRDRLVVIQGVQLLACTGGERRLRAAEVGSLVRPGGKCYQGSTQRASLAADQRRAWQGGAGQHSAARCSSTVAVTVEFSAHRWSAEKRSLPFQG